MRQIKDGDLVRVSLKNGTQLAESKRTPGGYRGSQLSKSNGRLDGQAEFFPVDEDNSYISYPKNDMRSEFEYEIKRILCQLIVDCATDTYHYIRSPEFKSWCHNTAFPTIKAVWGGLKSDKTRAEQIIGSCICEEAHIPIKSNNIIALPAKMIG